MPGSHSDKLRSGRKRAHTRPEELSRSVKYQRAKIKKAYSAAISSLEEVTGDQDEREGVSAGQIAAASDAAGGLIGRIRKILGKSFGHAGGSGEKMIGIAIAGTGLLLVTGIVAAAFSSCAAVTQSGTNLVVGTSYTAEERDILGAEEDYRRMEKELTEKIVKTEKTHPGYDEYSYRLDETGHDPYELAAFLTELFESYTRQEVQEKLKEVFERQYRLSFDPVTETRTRSVTRSGNRTVWDDEQGTWVSQPYEYVENESYTWKTLIVTLENRTLTKAIEEENLSEDEMQRMKIIYALKGNRPELFEEDIYANAVSPVPQYQVPGEALSDEQFARMIREGEKYLEMEYVWGGGTPEEGFDCSGFVSWVVNHSGNGWDYGRLSTDGLLNICSLVPKEEAKPGDLIFFQDAYETSFKTSHVGIYVGNNMMLHAGNPIHYTSISTNFWQSHFYGFGRLPEAGE